MASCQAAATGQRSLAAQVAEIAVKGFFAASELGNGASLYRACANDAKLYDSDGNLFMDMATFADADACAAGMAKLMGSTRLKYSERSLNVESDESVVVTHTVTVRDTESSSDEPVAVVRVRAQLTIDSNGKVSKATEAVLPDSAP